jgi:hypothetical protein
MLKPESYKWIVLISFLALIFLPKQMPLDWLKWIITILFGLICLIFEFASLKNSTKGEARQTYLLMLFTVIMAVVNFLV